MIKNFNLSHIVINSRDENSFQQAYSFIREIFLYRDHELFRVKKIANNIKEGIEKISPFIQLNTQKICPSCKDVCCINKHGYYNFEDLVYIHALSLKFPDYRFSGLDSDPCQFLSENGCSLERPFRPSGCNWYFCDPLLEYMENLPEYHEFDDSVRDLAELWIKMMEEFKECYKM